MSKNIFSKDDDKKSNVQINVKIDVTRIVGCLCATGLLIVGIIFGTRTFLKMMAEGFFDIED